MSAFLSVMSAYCALQPFVLLKWKLIFFLIKNNNVCSRFAHACKKISTAKQQERLPPTCALSCAFCAGQWVSKPDELRGYKLFCESRELFCLVFNQSFPLFEWPSHTAAVSCHFLPSITDVFKWKRGRGDRKTAHFYDKWLTVAAERIVMQVREKIQGKRLKW